MVSRRQLFSTVAAGIGLTPLLMWLARSEPAPEDAPPLSFPEEKSEAEWHAVLSPQQYHVLRERGTERPFSSTLNHEKRHGTFGCSRPPPSTTAERAGRASGRRSMERSAPQSTGATS